MARGGVLGPVLVADDAATLCVAGVALGDIHLDFTWQAWHNLTSTFVLRGRRGTHGTGWRAWARFSRGLALGDIHLDFTWQAWHNLTSTFVLRGRRGTHGTGWRAWARFSRGWRRGTLRGRRGTWWHPPSLRVAGVAQSHIHLRFACRVTLRGRRGAWWQPPSFHVAGVALMALVGALGPVLVADDDIHLDFTWQAWHNLTSTFVLRGRRGTHGTGWRAWARFSRGWRRGTLRGRRCPSSELLGRRTGACRTARQWVNESICPGEQELWPNVGRSFDPLWVIRAAEPFYRFFKYGFDNQLHIRALSFCGEVLLRSCIDIGPVTVGQARPSS